MVSYFKREKTGNNKSDVKTLSFSGIDFPGTISMHSQTIFGDSFIIAGGREHTSSTDIRYKTVYRWWHNFRVWILGVLYYTIFRYVKETEDWELQPFELEHDIRFSVMVVEKPCYRTCPPDRAITPCTTEYDTSINGVTTNDAIISGSDVEPCRRLCAIRGAVGFVFGRNTRNCYCTDHYSTKRQVGATAGTTSCIDPHCH